MAVQFICPNPHCPDHDVALEFVGETPAEPQCDCGAVLEPVDQDLVDQDADRLGAYSRSAATFEVRGG